MNPSNGVAVSVGSSPSLDDPRVMRAVEEYAARLSAGDAPDRAAFLARHAAIADVLARCLDGLELVHAGGRGLSGPVAAASLADDLLSGTPLGDFRLIRELGRGGMGIVYEAEQLSLGRPVALKVLPYAATMDGKQLQRFKNEARAAASLHHENIVPVYGVGCERGVHYYAMQLIEGRSLTDAIDELRQGLPSSSNESHGSPDVSGASGASGHRAATATVATVVAKATVSAYIYLKPEIQNFLIDKRQPARNHQALCVFGAVGTQRPTVRTRSVLLAAFASFLISASGAGMRYAVAYRNPSKVEDRGVGGPLVATPKELDLGKIPAGGSCKYTIVVRNTTHSPIRLDRVEVSCDCTSVTPQTVTIRPGEMIELSVTVDLKHEPSFVGNLRLSLKGIASDGATFVTEADLSIASNL